MERLVSVASAQNMVRGFASGAGLWFIDPSGAVRESTVEELSRHQKPFQVAFPCREKPFARSIEEALATLSGRAVFIALHGTEGEDGSMQELFESQRVAFTGSGARSSRLCFDKLAAKDTAERAGLFVCEQISFATRSAPEARAALADLFAKHGRLVMKPVANGSSVGLRIVASPADLELAAEEAAASEDPRFMAEPFVAGREVTVGVVDWSGAPEALPPSEVILEKGRSFDYEGKYLGLGSREVTPADLSPEETRACQEAALTAHRALGCEGYTRSDFILSEGRCVFLETNTLPGLSSASFLPQQLRSAGISLETFVERQMELARSRVRGRSARETD